MKEIEEKKPEIEGPDSFIGTIVFFVGLAGIICLGGWILRLLGVSYGILGIFLLILAVLLDGYKVVPKPEIWIIERFGKYNRNLEPGLRYVYPFIERVREKLKLYEQPLDGFLSIREIVFRDGPATLLNPRLWIEIDETHPQDAVYKVADYKKWAEGVSGPIIRGYLNTLTLDEALDEGAARGDILDKIRSRPEKTERQIKQIENSINEIAKKIDELNKSGKSKIEKSISLNLLKAAEEEKENEKREKEALLENQRKVRRELEEFEKRAKELGIKKIHRFTVGEFLLSEDLKKARESIHQARKEMISAISRATTEAIMRTEPIVKAEERFREIGFSPTKARENAFLIDILETLAKERSLFLTSAGKADLQSLAAQLTAIFSETKRRREKS